MSDVAVIVLAAGESRRMGSPKQLLSFRGVPLLRHTVCTALSVALGPVVVVVGAFAEACIASLAGLPVTIAENNRWQEGMGSSIQTGLKALDRSVVSAVILLLADQPLVTGDILRSLLKTHRDCGKRIVAARYSGTVGVPVLFAAESMRYLESLPPSQGCKALILAHADECALLDCPEAAIDVDTPQDYFHALASTPAAVQNR